MTESDGNVLCASKIGWAFGCSRKGTSHIRTNLPCQDSYTICTHSFSEESCLVVAVADGHGDKKHNLSQYGSYIATKIAVAELISFFVNFAANANDSLIGKGFENDFPRRIVRLWTTAIQQDAKHRDPTRYQKYHKKDALEVLKPYGTTLLTVLITSKTVCIGQIGDGDILLVRPDNIIETISQKSTQHIGMTVDSLCSYDAQKLWNTKVLERGAGGYLFISTDGLADSFTSEEQFHIFVRDLIKYMEKEGVEKVAQDYMPAWLDDCSEKGSRDDITLSVICLKSKEVTLNNQQQLISNNTAIR